MGETPMLLMKISFPTAACPGLHFPDAANLAGRLGFNGVELYASDSPATASLTNAVLTSPEKINRGFSDADVAISSLNVGSAGSELADRIGLAAELNCPVVRFACDDLLSPSPKVSARAVDWIQQCADHAASKRITLLIENKPTAGSAIAIWHLLDRIDHPAVACCWNTLSAFIAGDSPTVAVPTLNSRIQCVLIEDGKTHQSSIAFSDGPEGRVFSRIPSLNLALRAIAKRRNQMHTASPAKCTFSDGNVPIRKTLDRLRGIGFQGLLIVSPTIAASVEELELSLRKSLDALRPWNVLPAQATKR
jgi:sugar phosphate isomerase/epimerase